jgi:hypothetical protein
MPLSAPSLADATRQLYTAFRNYRVEVLVGCPCCTSEAQGRVLTSRPLQALTASDLERYTFKAISTWGTVSDFKHFLPRIFELMAGGAFEGFPDVEVILSKPEYGGLASWPAQEREAVIDFLHALWLDLLGKYPHALPADSCLCGIGRCLEDLTFFLEAWAESVAPSASLHLAAFVEDNQIRGGRLKYSPRLVNAYWEKRADQERQVWDWLMQPARLDQFERAFFQAEGQPGVQERLSDAQATLRLMQQLAVILGAH